MCSNRAEQRLRPLAVWDHRKRNNARALGTARSRVCRRRRKSLKVITARVSGGRGRELSCSMA
ncbi:MAG: hypothetical protein LBH53_03645 [Puniceicoccales bacterium]|nr:hypothetical protein [Puniceicoccales bacterium]